MYEIKIPSLRGFFVAKVGYTPNYTFKRVLIFPFNTYYVY